MNKLCVGYARTDITPGRPVPMAGYGNAALRYSERVLDPLYATCLAFTDEQGSTALIYALDILYAAGWMRETVSCALGIPVEQINFSASHTHAGPLTDEESFLPGVKEYLEETLKPGLIRAAKQALKDRRAARMYVTETRPEGLNYVRHYIMEDGTYGGPNFGNWKQPAVAHESEADHQMQLVKFVCEGGKDIILANFGVHQTSSGGMNKHDISADSAGAMREKMEAELDCRFAFFTGACGNVNPTSVIGSEPSITDHREHGRALADCALAVNETYHEVETGSVRVCRLPLEVEVDHSLDPLEEVARSIVQVWKETGDRAKCNQICAAHGLNSVYHAESVLDKLALGRTLGMELNAVSVGDVAFAMVPYEMFDTNGMELKDRSPFRTTVVATCSNQVRSYIPSALGFAHGGYSVDRCRFVPGTGERMVDEFVSMLNGLSDRK